MAVPSPGGEGQGEGVCQTMLVFTELCAQSYLRKNVSANEPFSVRTTMPVFTLCRANQPSLVSKTNWMLSVAARTEFVSFCSR